MTLQELAQSVAALPAEQYKQLLAQMLSRGLGDNEFEYPQGAWPPPTPARAYILAFLQHYADKVRGRCVEFDPPVSQPWLSQNSAVTSYDVWDTKPSTHATVVGDLQQADNFPDQVRGHCVEFDPPVYQSWLQNAAVTSYDVWDTKPSPHVTVVADLQQADNIPDRTFDTIICTHVLSAIRDVRRATAELHRLLAPGGLLLCTVPSILQKYAPHPRDYWRFTKDSMADVLGDFSRVEVDSFGNAATVAGSPYFLMVDHFPQSVLNTHDPSCPSIIAAAAWR